MGIEIIVYSELLIILENVKILFQCCFSSELIKPITNLNEENINKIIKFN